MRIAVAIATGSVFAQSNESNSDASSICRAYQSNLKAIEACDVLFRNEVTWTGLEGGVEQTRSTIRLKWQGKPEKCFVVIQNHQSRVIEGDTLPEFSQTTALVSDGERSYARLDQGDIRSFSFDPGRLLMSFGRVPSIHFIGITQYPTSYTPNYWESIDQLHSLLGPSSHRKFELSRGSVVRVRDERSQSTEIITFDLFELVPLSIVGYFHPTVGEKFVRWKESYEFDEKDEIRIPTQIVGEARNLKTINGVRLRGHDLYEVKIDWISINEPFDDRVFTKGQIEDMNKALKMLEPSEARSP